MRDDCYAEPIVAFLSADKEDIVDRLARNLAEAYSGRHKEQIEAWSEQLSLLDSALRRALQTASGLDSWVVALEYPLFRLAKRIDVALVGPGAVFVLEFKIGASRFDSASVTQVVDYALDLYDFHAGSTGRAIIPLLVATKAASRPESHVPPSRPDSVWPAVLTNSERLALTLVELLECLPPISSHHIAPKDWPTAPYRPTPSILEAAAALYSGNGVAEIAHARAEIKNLSATTDAVLDAVERAKANRKLTVCFVTGTPGSGKTLVGLNAVHHPRLRQAGTQGAYLSGTAPLVAVLRESLARDQAERESRAIGECRRVVQSEIQLLTGYLKEYLARADDRPAEHMIIFDEAQRAWDEKTGQSRFERLASEPTLFLEIMARHPDWAVIVALVGQGQEINRGEGGLREWGDALVAWNRSHPNRPWSVLLAPEGRRTGDVIEMPDGSSIPIESDGRLHLAVSARAHRWDVSPWVDAVLAGDLSNARDLAARAPGFNVFLTRSLAEARSWLSARTLGFRRCGLVASSGAKRLRAYGLGVALRSETRKMPETVNWFLGSRDDFRSSYALEVTASEYTCQGLELDYVGVCWGGDLLWSRDSSHWNFSQLSGPAWKAVRKEANQTFILNKYRVLLTRARCDLIIWIPEGDPHDRTRDPVAFDDTAEALRRAGALPADSPPY